MVRELNKLRFAGLLKHYRGLKANAKDLLKKGDMNAYITTLKELVKVKNELALAYATR